MFIINWMYAVYHMFPAVTELGRANNTVIFPLLHQLVHLHFCDGGSRFFACKLQAARLIDSSFQQSNYQICLALPYTYLQPSSNNWVNLLRRETVLGIVDVDVGIKCVALYATVWLSLLMN
jgi:hypothetical protein